MPNSSGSPVSPNSMYATGTGTLQAEGTALGMQRSEGRFEGCAPGTKGQRDDFFHKHSATSQRTGGPPREPQNACWPPAQGSSRYSLHMRMPCLVLAS